MSDLRRIAARFRSAYDRLYERLCGRPPWPLRPLHFKWLVSVDLKRDLRSVLPGISGRTLDVGCGEQPYRGWLGEGAEYVGIDVEAGPGIDAVVAPGGRWPLEDQSFDATLCTQVLEHDSRPEHTLAEIERVLKPGGTLVVTIPFAYNEHTMPHDYWRWSARGARSLLGSRFEVVEVRKQGRAGSLLGALWLNWLEHLVGRSPALQVLRALLLPVWLLYCLAVNAAARAIDALDRSGAFYLNVMVLARKPSG